MDKKTAGMHRWICQIYHNRGDVYHWEKFAEFCEAHPGLTDEPTPGRRKDNRDPWDVLEERLTETA